MTWFGCEWWSRLLYYAQAGTAPSQELIRNEASASGEGGGDGKGTRQEIPWDFAVLDARQRFLLRRKLEAYKWGSGRDYNDDDDSEA